VDCRVADDPRRECEEKRQGFSIANFPDNGDVGCHSQKSGDKATKVDRRTVGPRSTSLHARNIGKRGIDFEYFLGDDDSL
jgi:hypothetical protein